MVSAKDVDGSRGGFAAAPRNKLCPNFKLCLQSLEHDTPADAAWFAEHPGQHVRVRPPTPLEIAAFCLPKNSETIVHEIEPGQHVREFRSPRTLRTEK